MNLRCERDIRTERSLPPPLDGAVSFPGASYHDPTHDPTVQFRIRMTLAERDDAECGLAADHHG